VSTLADLFRVPAFQQSTSSVINLITLENLPALADQKIADAIRGIGGRQVTIRRLIKGQVRDDSQDVFVLEGRVPNQIALTRILTLAAEIVTGQATNIQDIHVLADEAGALATGNQNGIGGGGGGGGGGGFGGGGIGGGGIGGNGANLNNQIRRNVGRAKVLQAGTGRILSFIEVADLPQVRVDIRLVEVNRQKLKTYSPNFGVFAGTNRTALTVNGSQQLPQRTQAAANASGTVVDSILGFLNGTLATETQLTTSHFALDSVLSYLEQQGIARSLSSPSLTVLSGETATFQVGGDVPVSQSFAPAIGGNNIPGTTGGVFTTVTFLNFGIQLDVRPLVGDDDALTLDLAPLVTTSGHRADREYPAEHRNQSSDVGVSKPLASHQRETAGRAGAGHRRSAFAKHE